MTRVLIADDHEVTLRGIHALVQEAFEEVSIDAATDYPTLMTALQGRRYDLLILDLLMPGANVMDALREIRARHAELPILILTAVTELEYVFETMKVGANGLIHKHRAAGELVTAIRQVASGADYLHPETAAAIASSVRPVDTTLLHTRLSQREFEIFCAIARGKALKEIAGDLSLSDKTIATYLGRIREKTGLTTYVDIARYALQQGLTD